MDCNRTETTTRYARDPNEILYHYLWTRIRYAYSVGTYLQTNLSVTKIFLQYRSYIILCNRYFIFILVFISGMFYSILFYSILFYSILFYSILFYSILFYSILFYSILFYSILFY